MTEINELLGRFESVAARPRAQLDAYLAQGKRVIGCFPYYVPEELVEAAGMVPFGVWGAEGTVRLAKEYFAPFYCTVAQMGLELGLAGKLDGLSGVIMPSLCDTLRPLTQNFRTAVPQIPFLFLAHPQNRRLPVGQTYLESQYARIKKRLEEISGTEITANRLREAIHIYNESRGARREFVRLAGRHPAVVSPTKRCAVLKSAHFMQKAEHTALLKRLNGLLAALPETPWSGSKILTSGILADSGGILRLFEDYHLAIAADDVAHESRGFRLDAPETGDPMRALTAHFSAQGCDTMLYEPDLENRPKHVVELARSAGADGVVILMMQFCDPEELEFPSLGRALAQADIPYLKIDADQQTRDYGQAKTSLQAFAELLAARHR